MIYFLVNLFFSVRQRNTNASQIKVTKMLLLVSTVFVLLNLPSYVMRVRAYIEVSIICRFFKTRFFNFLNYFYDFNFSDIVFYN